MMPPIVNLHALDTSFMSCPIEMMPSPVSHGAGMRTRVTDDVYEQACNLTAWQQLYDQMRPGRFSGAISELWLDGIQLFKESTNLALRQTCMVWPSAIWFGLPSLENKESYIGASCVDDASIALCPGGYEFELSTPDHLAMMGLVIPQTEFEKYPEYDDLNLKNMFANSHSLQIGEARKAAYLQWMNETLSTMEKKPQVEHAAVQKILKDALMNGILDILEAATLADAPKASYQHYQKIVRGARDFLIAHPSEPFTILDLCQNLYVCRRTLQNAFQAVLQVNPIAYLRALRLNAVRRELESHHSPHLAICDAAAAWGFWHMSQFARDYQKLFGERPSATLARRGIFSERLKMG